MNFRIIPAAFLLFFIFIGVSCNRKSSQVKEIDLYYFPAKNTYYDLKTASYYYSLDSAKTWDSMVYSGSDYGAALGSKIPLKRFGKYPWSKNDSLRKVYNGRLLNLVNRRTYLIARADSLSRIKPIVVFRPKLIEKAREEVAKEDEPKKGLKKFFNKLFKKKERDKKE